MDKANPISPVSDHLPPTDADEFLKGTVDRARSGDEAAFGELMKGEYERVFRVVNAMLLNEHDAREVCQDVWLTVWKQLPTFRGESKFSTWLHAIATRRALDHLRRRKRWFSRFIPIFSSENSDAVAPVEATQTSTPRHDLEQGESVAELRRLIDSLPPKLRAVLALREVNGLSYEEIAQTLNCRTGTVMSRLHNARRLLVQKLGESP
jgi:RNA polymerase sigma-70 factor, ECF subfamily